MLRSSVSAAKSPKLVFKSITTGNAFFPSYYYMENCRNKISYHTGHKKFQKFFISFEKGSLITYDVLFKIYRFTMYHILYNCLEFFVPRNRWLVYTMESMNSIVLADREYFSAFCNHLFTQHLIHHECSCCAKVVPWKQHCRKMYWQYKVIQLQATYEKIKI